MEEAVAKNNEQKLNEHEIRIKTLEESDADKEKRLRDVEKNYTRLESTILQENRDTRHFFQTTMDKQWDLIKSMGSLSENEKIRKHEMEKTRFERHTEIFLKIGGAGGLLYIIIQSILEATIK